MRATTLTILAFAAFAVGSPHNHDEDCDDMVVPSGIPPPPAPPAIPVIKGQEEDCDDMNVPPAPSPTQEDCEETAAAGVPEEKGTKPPSDDKGPKGEAPKQEPAKIKDEMKPAQTNGDFNLNPMNSGAASYSSLFALGPLGLLSSLAVSLLLF